MQGTVPYPWASLWLPPCNELILEFSQVAGSMAGVRPWQGLLEEPGAWDELPEALSSPRLAWQGCGRPFRCFPVFASLALKVMSDNLWKTPAFGGDNSEQHQRGGQESLGLVWGWEFGASCLH